jgi:disulfide oxidoreductase YuzD
MAMLIKIKKSHEVDQIAPIMNPKVIIERTELSQNCYISDGKSYDVSTLISFCKEKGYKPFDMPLACINISANPFDIQNFYEFLDHFKRVENCDLKYPIILTDMGYIADGWHRVAKAILSGKTSIKAIRMTEMPLYSGKVTKHQP